MKKYPILWLFTFLISFVGLIPTNAAALAIPTLTQRITDLTHTLDNHETYQLEQEIIQFEKNHPDGSQLAVLIVSTLAGETVENYAARVFQDWQLGQGGKDNGVLLLIVLNDRVLRIEVGYGLEGQLTDLKSKQIIDRYLVPNFTNAEYTEGISQAIKAIDSVITDPVNNLLETDVKIDQMYSEFVQFGVLCAAAMIALSILVYAIKPASFKKCLKHYFKMFILVYLLVGAYISYNYLFDLVTMLKGWGLFLVISFSSSLMCIFTAVIVQIFMGFPVLSLINKLFYKKSDKKLEFKLFGRSTIFISIISLGIFILLPGIIKFLICFIGMIALFIYSAKNGTAGNGNSGSGGRSGSSGSRSSGGFSGGGGRSGGGGSSGRW
ncbi:TPM domain-containing protein [Zophobihabitans entericus]|uniref:TPM domain-containing protein n=1 Tax=Zophobihabitans entericus TaxID=1635327 RepID=A0A6G9IA51_9GAMM|nr:TPM domain-containing protein [Zophobihabitans entericus]QIQ20709.1 hypothetical protein IPMB12_02845 [Zophobihabitans entericus]